MDENNSGLLFDDNLIEKKQPPVEKTAWATHDKLSREKEKIIALYTSRLPANIDEANKMCEKLCLDRKQFELYYKPEEEKNGNGNSHPVETAQNTAAKQKTANKWKYQGNATTPAEPKKSFLNLSGEEILFYDSLPYAEKELNKLNLPALVKIINGCFNSYGSREIIRAFNPREFLGKMYGIVNLRSDISYMREIHAGLINNNLSVDAAFYTMIKDLDTFAYNEQSWMKQTEKFVKDKYSTAKNEEKNRTDYIPEIEKAIFIESIFFKPKDYASKHSYINRTGYDFRLNGRNKSGHIDFLMEQLNKKWNNLEDISWRD